jgi:MFS family permease
MGIESDRNFHPDFFRFHPMPRLSKQLTIMLTFSFHALVVGSLFSRIAEIQQGLGLGEAVFGIVLTGIPAGVFVGSPLVGHLIERYGPRRTLLTTIPAFAAGTLLVALAAGPEMLFGALFVQGFLLTTCNIAMNVEADRIEAATGRRLLNRCHGSWGLGFLLVSLSGAGAIATGISPLLHFVILFVVLAVANLLVVAPMIESPPRHHAGGGRPRRFALPSTATFLIAAYALSGIWLEGATRNWSIIYLRDVFSAVDWEAALALPAIVSMQTLGRFAADSWMDRFGVVPVSRVLTVVSLAGLGVIAFSESTELALTGFALIGLGISTVHPQAISAAARWGDRPASQNVAAFSTVQTLIIFMSPPIFGLVAAQFGLRVSFMLILPLPLLALYFVRFLTHGDNAAKTVQASGS